MQQVGKEAVTDLRNVVKQKFSDVIQGPIVSACQKFVKEGNNAGPGVRQRILILFEGLARNATKAAQDPAVKLLQEKFLVVRKDIRTAFDAWGDPIQDTADLIVQRHSERVDQSNAERREEVLQELNELMKGAPLANKPESRAA